MARVKRGVTARARHNKILGKAKGYYLAKSKLYKIAKEQVQRSRQLAYRDRRAKKREFRALWIARINAGTREHGMSYSRFISGLKKANVAIDRKVLSDIAVFDKPGFAELVKTAQAALQ